MSDSDPRRGLPSASIMWQVANCPGRQTLVTSLREVGKLYELPNSVQSSGVKIHHYLAFEAISELAPQAAAYAENLTADERMVANKAAELRNNLLKEWLGHEWGLEDGSVIIEHRFWYRQGLTPRFTGQPDYIYRNKNRALVINYKTGRKEGMPVADNLQLRTEIVLLKHAHPELIEIAGAIVEPLVSWDSERVEYKSADLALAEKQILAFVDRAQWERDRRIPGPWCEHCPARAYCREALAYIQTIPNPNIGSIMQDLPRGEPGVVLWEKIKLAKKLLETLEATYEQILETEPDALPGYLLPKQGHKRAKVPYPAKLKAALAEYLTGDEIDGCAEYHVGKIEELFGLKHKLAGKSLSTQFAELVRDAIAIMYDRPFIRPLTKKERAALTQ